jgi:hypothetical protein
MQPDAPPVRHVGSTGQPLHDAQRAYRVASTQPPPTTVDLVIKDSYQLAAGDLRLTVPLAGTVRQIKAMISQAHPDQPAPATQRLIFAGRLLQDATSTAEVLRQARATRCAASEGATGRSLRIHRPRASPRTRVRSTT